MAQQIDMNDLVDLLGRESVFVRGAVALTCTLIADNSMRFRAQLVGAPDFVALRHLVKLAHDATATHSPQRLLAAMGALRCLASVPQASLYLQNSQLMPLLVDLLVGQLIYCSEDMMAKV